MKLHRWFPTVALSKALRRCRIVGRKLAFWRKQKAFEVKLVPHHSWMATTPQRVLDDVSEWVSWYLRRGDRERPVVKLPAAVMGNEDVSHRGFDLSACTTECYRRPPLVVIGELTTTTHDENGNLVKEVVVPVFEAGLVDGDGI
jgi:hypothetical protein